MLVIMIYPDESRTFYCSELVICVFIAKILLTWVAIDKYMLFEQIASMYKRAGILRENLASAAYLPGHFSSRSNLLLLLHCSLGDELILSFKSKAAPIESRLSWRGDCWSLLSPAHKRHTHAHAQLHIIILMSWQATDTYFFNRIIIIITDNNKTKPSIFHPHIIIITHNLWVDKWQTNTHA